MVIAMPPPFRKERGDDLALPTLVLVNQQSTIRWIYRPENYRVRAQPDEIMRQIDQMQRLAVSQNLKADG